MDGGQRERYRVDGRLRERGTGWMVGRERERGLTVMENEDSVSEGGRWSNHWTRTIYLVWRREGSAGTCRRRGEEERCTGVERGQRGQYKVDVGQTARVRERATQRYRVNGGQRKSYRVDGGQRERYRLDGGQRARKKSNLICHMRRIQQVDLNQQCSSRNRGKKIIN